MISVGADQAVRSGRSQKASAVRAAMAVAFLKCAVVDSPLRRTLARSAGTLWTPYQTAKRRYYRWIEMGVFDRLFEAIASQPDLEWLMIDATVIRARTSPSGRGAA